MAQVVWTARALRDLASLREYISRERPAAAERQVERILTAVERLARFPESGRRGRRAGSRELVINRTPYLVPYRVRGRPTWPAALAGHSNTDLIRTPFAYSRSSAGSAPFCGRPITGPIGTAERSYKLYARFGMPHFRRPNTLRLQSYDWCTEHRDELSEKRSAAARAMFDKHEAERRAATARPPRGREAWFTP